MTSVARLDGYRIDSIALRPARTPRRSVREDMVDLQYVAKIPLPAPVSLGWYTERPQAAPPIPLTPELRERAALYPSEPWSAFLEWNLAYLTQPACRARPNVTTRG